MSIRTEPVRLYAIIMAALTLVQHYVPDIPTPLILGLVAAVLGVGEGVRAVVTPVAKLPDPKPEDRAA